MSGQTDPRAGKVLKVIEAVQDEPDHVAPLIVARALGLVVRLVALRSGCSVAQLLGLSEQMARVHAGVAPVVPAPCAQCVQVILTAGGPNVSGVFAGHCPHDSVGFALTFQTGRCVKALAVPMTAQEASQRMPALEWALRDLHPATPENGGSGGCKVH